MIFGESFSFLGGASEMDLDDRVTALSNILQTFNRETITHIVLKSNYMMDGILK
jgi:hypothetical protein